MRKLPAVFFLIFVFTIGFIRLSYCQPDGFIKKGNQVLFPIGFYENPKEPGELQQMAESGINLVRCHSKEDLDRAESAGMMGIAPLPLHSGATDKLREYVRSIKDHSALAVWEGPDEIVWNFTAASMLQRTKGVHKQRGEWWNQTENAVEYSKKQAATIIPNMRDAVAMIRKMDRGKHPVWINEALESDLIYVRQYLDFVDITGCDIYPVKKEDRRIHRMGPSTDRWVKVGRGIPVWMVLQAFAWSELGDYYAVKDTAYPTFDESRFMAYDVLAHGASGILYWGSHYLKSEEFRRSVYALTSELAALQPFLTAKPVKNISLRITDIPDEDETTRGVKVLARRHKKDWCVILINEDNHSQMGVEITGLKALNGKTLDLLYTQESAEIKHGELLTRMRPYEVQVFATGRKWETMKQTGRDYAGLPVK